jgi:hypothetical protein
LATLAAGIVAIHVLVLLPAELTTATMIACVSLYLVSLVVASITYAVHLKRSRQRRCDCGRFVVSANRPPGADDGKPGLHVELHHLAGVTVAFRSHHTAR